MSNSIFSKYLTIFVIFSGSIVFSFNAVADGKGEAVFKGTCSMCHRTGVMGAPKFGNKDDWAPRIAKGKDTLYDHALHGFKGKKGTMPPKGGKPSLSDADVKAAVDYMVSKAK